MKLQQLAKRVTQLIDTELRKKIDKAIPDHSILTAQSFHDLFREWHVGSALPVIRYETDMMGSGNTIYIKLARVVFAVVQNYDACPDGMNRFIMVVPLYSETKSEGILIYGFHDISLEYTTDAMEAFVNILADLHNASL